MLVEKIDASGKAVVKKPPKSDEPMATVVLVGEKSFVGSETDADFVVDGQRVGSVKRRESVTFQVAPGAHTVSVIYTLGNNDMWHSPDLEVDLEAGQRGDIPCPLAARRHRPPTEVPVTDGPTRQPPGKKTNRAARPLVTPSRQSVLMDVPDLRVTVRAVGERVSSLIRRGSSASAATTRSVGGRRRARSRSVTSCSARSSATRVGATRAAGDETFVAVAPDGAHQVMTSSSVPAPTDQAPLETNPKFTG